MPSYIQTPGTPRQFQRRELLAAVGLAMVATGAGGGCQSRGEPAFLRLTEARQRAAELRVAFNKAADASNLAVMADTDEASAGYAAEAEQSKQAVQKDTDALTALLADYGHPDEIGLLASFGKHFADYQPLDHTLLGLAVENTNLKAQRLAFGPALDAADAFQTALESLTGSDRARVEALGLRAALAVRQVEVLHAPHIAEADDAAMTRIEQKMSDLIAAARDALGGLAGIVAAGSKVQLKAANDALDRFLAVHAQIVSLSRTNINVRSLALALGQMRGLTVQCDSSLSALADALANEGSKATR